MATVHIEPEQAIKYGNEILGVAAEYNNEIKAIYSIMDDLKKEWTGQAAQRFTNDVETYRVDYEKFGKLINDFGELLTAIGKDYKNLEDNL